ncbi:hypothetical protein LY76DRAFT_304509 [Colletotrichum caudatum]|nr:hypothetical protein LY76DRAFT_304509 [Colletotrichum caudatum]
MGGGGTERGRGTEMSEYVCGTMPLKQVKVGPRKYAVCVLVGIWRLAEGSRSCLYCVFCFALFRLALAICFGLVKRVFWPGGLRKPVDTVYCVYCTFLGDLGSGSVGRESQGQQPPGHRCVAILVDGAEFVILVGPKRRRCWEAHRGWWWWWCAILTDRQRLGIARQTACRRWC